VTDDAGANGASGVLGEDLGAMPLPCAVSEAEAAFPGTGGSCPTLGGGNLLVNPQADDADTAIQVAEAMTSDEFQLRLFELANLVPARPDLLETSRARAVQPLGRYLETIKHAGENAIPRPSSQLWHDHQLDFIVDEVREVLTQRKSPRQGAIDMGRRFETSQG